MPQAPFPSNEAERLEALRLYEILDSGEEQEFDDLTHLASIICGTPISLVSLIAEDRQFFKSHMGLDVEQTGREVSFCSYAILKPDEIMEISDALEDPRVSDMALVHQSPYIRFYAGAPLVTQDGIPIGTLCVIDSQPRHLRPDQRQALTMLGRQAMALIEMRRLSRQLKLAMNEAEIAQQQLALRNQELEQARDTAIRSAESKAQFLANMSHEIRTPMNGVIGMADLLIQTPLNPEQLECTQIIRQSASALLTIINDVLDFSRIEAGKMVLSREAFSLPDLLHSVVAILRPGAKDKGLTLEVQSPTNPAWLMMGVPDRMRQILINLISNAIKFTARGGVTVSWNWGIRDGHAIDLGIDVIDTGIGIPGNRLHAIFDSFTQADGTTTRQYGGTGLGLTISRQLARMMGGDITVTSMEGFGSTFTLRLSLERIIEETPLPDSSGTLWTPTPDAHSFGLRVLLAEDNIVNQRVATLLLNRLGCEVDVAANGAEAVGKVVRGTTAYDLILMDCQMPEMDGHEATRELRRRGIGLPIVAMTAGALEGDRQKCIDSGMDDYLTKPIDQGRLESLLAAYSRK